MAGADVGVAYAPRDVDGTPPPGGYDSAHVPAAPHATPWSAGLPRWLIASLAAAVLIALVGLLVLIVLA